MDVNHEDRIVSYLPLSHIAAQVLWIFDSDDRKKSESLFKWDFDSMNYQMYNCYDYLLLVAISSSSVYLLRKNVPLSFNFNFELWYLFSLFNSPLLSTSFLSFIYFSWWLLPFTSIHTYFFVLRVLLHFFYLLSSPS